MRQNRTPANKNLWNPLHVRFLPQTMTLFQLGW